MVPSRSMPLKYIYRVVDKADYERMKAARASSTLTIRASHAEAMFGDVNYDRIAMDVRPEGQRTRFC
jgi:hypothetical protein